MRQGSWYWTPARVVAAMQVFEEVYGRRPSYNDFNPSRSMTEQYERFQRDGCWPSGETVKRHWGSWNAAIAAAGWEPYPSGVNPGRTLTPLTDCCARGHPFTPENTKIRTKRSGTTVRVCMTCKRDHNNASYARVRRQARTAAP